MWVLGTERGSSARAASLVTSEPSLQAIRLCYGRITVLQLLGLDGTCEIPCVPPWYGCSVRSPTLSLLPSFLSAFSKVVPVDLSDVCLQSTVETIW